jgi:hypothetical protein
MNTMHVNTRKRSCLTRTVVAGMMSVVLLTGCASEGPTGQSSLPFGKNARDESIRQQAKADSFPTAQQAGL